MSGISRFQKLLSPGRIGQMEIRNRIVMAPMGTNFGTEDGFVTPRMKKYYEARARGGVGLIIVEIAAVDYPRGAAMPCQLALSDDKYITGLAELVDIVHRHGAKIALQLHHAGKLSTTDLAQGRVPVAPSTIPIPTDQVLQDMSLAEIMKVAQRFSSIPEGGLQAREATVAEIGQIVLAYAQAAERAKKAGFDGVEIHAGHSYLIAEFLSRASNMRRDAYGGDLKSRARLLLEIIGAIRQRVGDQYPVWCRLDGKEYNIENGITLQESREIALMAVKAGLDAIHVSGYGGPGGVGFTEAPLVHEPGYLLPAAEAIKKAVKVPVIAVGRIGPDLAEAALHDSQADFIAMGRPLLADPDLPKKLDAERLDQIRPCIYCYTCVGQIFLNEPVKCTVNPQAGRETEFRLDHVGTPKKVLVVGGGPAGLEAARLAAHRGHMVVLCEKERRLGGALVFAGIMRAETNGLVSHLKSQLHELAVDVRLRKQVTARLIESVRPDAVVLAQGARRIMPPIPGADRKNVISGEDLQQFLAGRPNKEVAKKLPVFQRALLYVMSPLLQQFFRPSIARELTRLWMPLGHRVVIIGGQIVGCEMADFLVHRGRKVTILEKGDALAEQMAIPRRWRALQSLRDREVTMMTGVTFKEITDKSVVITTKEGQAQTIETDTVVLAVGLVPNMDLFNTLQGKVPEVHLAGDCTELRLIEGSIEDGARVGSAI